MVKKEKKLPFHVFMTFEHVITYLFAYLHVSFPCNYGFVSCYNDFGTRIYITFRAIACFYFSQLRIFHVMATFQHVIMCFYVITCFCFAQLRVCFAL